MLLSTSMSGENLDEPSAASWDSSAQDAAEAGPSGGEVPSSRSAIFVEGRVVLRLGAAIMVLSSLLDWLKVGDDSFPHVTGIDGTTLGTGLALFVLGLSLLLRDWSIGITLGKALGSFSLNVVFFLFVGTDSGQLGAGPWVGLVGTAVALIGAGLVAAKSVDQAELELSNPLQAGLGAVLAIVASFWLDWVAWPVWGYFLGPGFETADIDIGAISGVDPEVFYGIPVLILASVALLLVVGAFFESLTKVKLSLLTIQIAGISVSVIAGANALSGLVGGLFVFGSAPFVALAGGVLLAGAVREPDSRVFGGAGAN